MSDLEILGQDEIDALMNGIDSGEVPTEAPPARGEARPHDFTRYGRIVRGRMPTLEMINDRFGRLLRGSLYNELRRAAVISVGSVQIAKFADYVRTLHLPTSLNLVKFSPLRGTALIILDPTLVFSLIDIYFGGKGRHAKIEAGNSRRSRTRSSRMSDGYLPQSPGSLVAYRTAGDREGRLGDESSLCQHRQPNGDSGRLAIQCRFRRRRRGSARHHAVLDDRAIARGAGFRRPK